MILYGLLEIASANYFNIFNKYITEPGMPSVQITDAQGRWATAAQNIKSQLECCSCWTNSKCFILKYSAQIWNCDLINSLGKLSIISYFLNNFK